jgi:proline-specific peptidase
VFLIAIHGGPGISHAYKLPHLDLAKSCGIPVILYDQIGIGKSTHLPDKPASFWTPKLFMDELENLVAFFGITARYDLLGHSWGGMLAAQFAAERQPAGLTRLVISGACASIQLLADATNKLLNAFPQEFRDMIHKHEREKTTDSQEYQDGMGVFYSKHICQVDPFPEVLNESFGAMGEDPTVYSTM